MLTVFLFLIQTAQPSGNAVAPQVSPEMAMEQALAKVSQVKLSIGWSESDRAYICEVKEGSGIAWLDPIPCAALKKCEKGRMQKQEELMPCIQAEVVANIQKILQP